MQILPISYAHRRICALFNKNKTVAAGAVDSNMLTFFTSVNANSKHIVTTL